MFSVLIATCSSDLIVALHRGSHSAITQLRVIPLCESFFLKVHLAWGMTLWVPTHVPQPLMYLPFSRTMHVVLPWAWLSHGSYRPPGLPSVAWALHESGYSLLVLELWPWSHISLLFITVLGCVLTRRCFNLAIPSSSDAFSLQRLALATPYFGDAFSWRRLVLPTPPSD